MLYGQIVRGAFGVFTHLRGYILRATSMPGQYDRKAARAVSSNRPKMRIRFLRRQRVNIVKTTEICNMSATYIQYKSLNMYILHSLLQDGVPPGLTDDQIGPLHDHDTGEESCVAGELYNLSALVCLVDRMFNKRLAHFPPLFILASRDSPLFLSAWILFYYVLCQTNKNTKFTQ